MMSLSETERGEHPPPRERARQEAMIIADCGSENVARLRPVTSRCAGGNIYAECTFRNMNVHRTSTDACHKCGKQGNWANKFQRPAMTKTLAIERIVKKKI